MQYFAGIDGSGSSTVAVLVDEKGDVVARGKANSSNVSQYGKEVAISIIADLVNEMAQQRKVRSLCAGLSGLERAGDLASINSALRTLALAETSEAVSDGMMILEAATLGRPGVVLVAEGGVSSWGTDGRSYKRADGWGYFLGDNGGAIDISRRGMVAALKYYDGRGSSTRLLNAMLEYFGVSSPEEVVGKVYGKPVSSVIGFANFVLREAFLGDEVALSIVRDAAAEMAATARAVINALHILSPEVFYWGSLLQNEFFRSQVSKELGLPLVRSPYQPVVGAVLLALKNAGVEPTEDFLKKFALEGELVAGPGKLS